MRLLTLCSLASREASLSYARVAEVLEMEESQVEELLIECIAHNLLDASLDQLPRTITVKHCVRRSFESEDWRALQRKLKMWRQNIASVVAAAAAEANSGASQ